MHNALVEYIFLFQGSQQTVNPQDSMAIRPKHCGVSIIYKATLECKSVINKDSFNQDKNHEGQS